MKQIVNNKPNEVIDVSEVVSDFNLPIGVVFNRREDEDAVGQKSLVVRDTCEYKVVYKRSFIRQLLVT
jgi:hypothetical protein